MKTVGLIGLGNAGKPLGERLLRRGYPLKVFDINPEPMAHLAKLGASAAASLKDATSTVTLTALPSSVEAGPARPSSNVTLYGLKDSSLFFPLAVVTPVM